MNEQECNIRTQHVGHAVEVEPGMGYWCDGHAETEAERVKRELAAWFDDNLTYDTFEQWDNQQFVDELLKAFTIAPLPHVHDEFCALGCRR